MAPAAVHRLYEALLLLLYVTYTLCEECASLTEEMQKCTNRTETSELNDALTLLDTDDQCSRQHTDLLSCFISRTDKCEFTMAGDRHKHLMLNLQGQRASNEYFCRNRAAFMDADACLKSRQPVMDDCMSRYGTQLKAWVRQRTRKASKETKVHISFCSSLHVALYCETKAATRCGKSIELKVHTFNSKRLPTICKGHGSYYTPIQSGSSRNISLERSSLMTIVVMVLCHKSCTNYVMR